MTQFKMSARVVLAFLGIVALMFALVIPQARAEGTVRVEVHSARAVKSDANGTEKSEGEQAQLNVDDVARVTIGFTALEASTIKQGDTLRFSIPPEFEAYSKEQFDLRFGAEGAGIAGTCMPSPQEIVCTINEVLEQHAAIADDRAPGELWYVVKAKEASQNTQFDFAVNGIPAVAPVPLGIVGAEKRFVPQAFDKVSTPIEKTHKEIPWVIRFHGGDIARRLGVEFDGTAQQRIEFEDTLGDEFQVFPSTEEHQALLSRWTLEETETAALTGRRQLARVGGSLADGFELTVEFTPEGKARIVATGPFRADANYAVGIPMPLKPELQGNACGREYHNGVALVHTGDLAATKPVLCDARAAATINLTQGYGTIKVVKQFQNPENVAAESFFQADYSVKVKYSFPGGARAGDFKVDGGEYVPPGTLNEEQTGGEAFIKLTSAGGGELRGELEGVLPKGTSVVLTEILPRVDGMVWKAPEFQPSNTFNIEDLKSSEVVLKNTIQKVASEQAPVKILKKVEGNGKHAPKSFDFLVQCEGQPDKEVRVEVNKETGVGNYDVGKECTVTEKDSAPVEGYILHKQDPQKLVIPNEGHTFVFVNQYVQDHGPTGTFTITKVVEAEEGLPVPETFDFAYRCEKEGTADVFVDKIKGVVPNVPHQSPKIPLGFTCSISELNADIPQANLETKNPGTVNVGDNITVTNVYKRIIPLEGTFTVKKVLEVDPGVKVPSDFDFTYRCTKPGGQDVTGVISNVKAGATASSAKIPPGYLCVVTEEDAKVDGADWNVVVSGEASANQVVTVTNTYSRREVGIQQPRSSLPWWLLGIPLLGGLAAGNHQPKVSEGPESTPSVPTHTEASVETTGQGVQNAPRASVLAQTGASVFGVIALAVIALVIGVFLVLRKKK